FTSRFIHLLRSSSGRLREALPHFPHFALDVTPFRAVAVGRAQILGERCGLLVREGTRKARHERTALAVSGGEPLKNNAYQVVWRTERNGGAQCEGQRA